MSDKTMKIVLSALTSVLLVLIVCLFAFKGNSSKADLNKLALRIGELRQYRTMSRADVNGAMERAFGRVGYNVVSSTEDNLYPATAENAGVNIYVRGYVPFNELKVNKNAVNVVYIRDFDALYPEELGAYDGIATSSRDFYNYIRGTGYAGVYLPEFTDPSVFYPNVKPNLERDLLYVGDNDRHSPAITAALEAKLPLEIFGRFWQGNIDEEFIKGEYIHDNELASYFSSAKINLVNISVHESELGIIPSRVFDIAASKGFMIAPYNKEVEATFGDSIPMYKNAEELKALYEQYLNNAEARAEKAEKAYRIAVADYNVDAFVQRVNGLVEFLINEKKL
ncbi:MAG: glycosyltransferase [Alphaproteobacteria bacterium]|nr:glycosyltransferase [Alphaproteobacteria bacterium]